MVAFLTFMFFVGFVAWLTLQIKSFFYNTSRNIVSVVSATKFSSGKVTAKEMEARNIIPYFCSTENMVIWVHDPAFKEICPSCGSDIYKIFRGQQPPTQLDKSQSVR